MTYNEAVKYINSFLVFGSKLGLERIEGLLNKLGNPQDKLKFIHVAGTNGKGSICAYTASILSTAGYRTGLFVSPYIIDFRERFQIDGSMIEKAQLCEITAQVKSVVDTLGEDEIPTEFELVTAIGFLYFAKNNCDVVVLEVGLGGRFDSTNVIKTSLVSVIASISLDHTAILGDTVEKIAFEKAGIIKENGKTVLYPVQPGKVTQVIKQIASEKHNEIFVAEDGFEVVEHSISGDTVIFDSLKFKLPILGEYQPLNAICGVLAVKKGGFELVDEVVVKGIERTRFPARCEVISENPIIILDGAHNPDGVKSLEKVLNLYATAPVGVIGMMRDKDINAVLSTLAPLFSKIFTVTVDNPRSCTAEELAKAVKKYNKNVVAAKSIEKAIEAAAAQNNDFCVCGSFYLCGEAEKFLKKYK